MLNITEKQNEEKYLKLQYLAKTSFDLAEKWSSVLWVVAIVNVIFCNVLFFSKALGNWYVGITVSLSVISLMVETFIQKFNNRGAASRQYIDFSLYRFEPLSKYYTYSAEDLIEAAERIVSNSPQKAHIIMHNTGEDKPRGVRNWYEIGNIEDNTSAIFKCQEANIWFDKKLSYAYLAILITSFAIISVTTVIICKFTSTSFWLIIGLYWTLVQKMLVDIIKMIRYLFLSNQIHGSIETIREGNLQINHLIKLQSYIDERRSLTFVVANGLHNLFSNKLHKLWRSHIA